MEKEHSTTRDSPLTPEKEHSTTRDYPLTPEKEHSTTKDYPLTPKKKHSTTRDSPLNLEKEHSTTRDSPLNLEKEHSTTRDSPLTPEKDPLSLKKKHSTTRDSPLTPEKDPLTLKKKRSTTRDSPLTEKEHSTTRDYPLTLKKKYSTTSDYPFIPDPLTLKKKHSTTRDCPLTLEKEHSTTSSSRDYPLTRHKILSKFTPENLKKVIPNFAPILSASVCALVGFIIVGSIALAGLNLAMQNASQINHQDSSIAELKQIIVILQTSINYSIQGSQIGQGTNLVHLQNMVNEFQSTIMISRSLSSKIDKIIQTLSGQYPNFPATSCSDIFLSNPLSPSGHYWIRSSNGSAVHVYCDFNRPCGCDGPSVWTHVASLDMSDPSHVCPSNWVTISNPVRTCGIGSTNTGCRSVFYSTFGITYSRVCGRIIAYQQGAPDGLNLAAIQNPDINTPHLDGVSLTHGSGSRQHIWSFICAAGEGNTFRPPTVCACSNSRDWPYSTSFIGNDYFCDSGNHGPISSSGAFYSDDPLWDGQGCGSSSTCCQFNNPPWFCKTLPQSTTNDLEVRICKNSNNEDTPVQLVELYIQ